MILNVSGRTDIVAFYTPWFMKRYKEGYVEVRNPFYPKQISHISFLDVDAIVFCTKNPLPILSRLEEIQKPILFQVTLTPYKKDIEPYVPPKGMIIKAIQKLSKQLGKENVYVRYDPIFINNTYTVDYHIKSFEKMCALLEGDISHIIVSFMDTYKNTEKNKEILRVQDFTEELYQKIGISFSKSAKKHGMTVQTCSEERNLVEYGFIKRDCVDKNIAYRLTRKTHFKEWKARDAFCHCVEMVDIGAYNSCPHLCKYCYANFDEDRVEENRKRHDIDSSLLIGNLTKEDKIKDRK